MKKFRGFALGLALGLAAALSTVGWAQSSTPTDQNQKTEMSCCKGDSCSMKDHQQKDHAKMHAAGHQGCCCCGDSCDMKMDHKEKAN